MMDRSPLCILAFFFFNDTATTEIYTLSLHDALPICALEIVQHRLGVGRVSARRGLADHARRRPDRKSTRLNSSHQIISYAVFCLKKKKHLDLSPRHIQYMWVWCPAHSTSHLVCRHHD